MVQSYCFPCWNDFYFVRILLSCELHHYLTVNDMLWLAVVMTLKFCTVLILVPLFFSVISAKTGDFTVCNIFGPACLL